MAEENTFGRRVISWQAPFPPGGNPAIAEATSRRGIVTVSEGMPEWVPRRMSPMSVANAPPPAARASQPQPLSRDKQELIHELAQLMGVHEGGQHDDFAMSADRKYFLPRRSPQWLAKADRASLLDSMCSAFVKAVAEERQAMVEETPLFHSAERSGLLWLVRGPSRSEDPLVHSPGEGSDTSSDPMSSGESSPAHSSWTSSPDSGGLAWADDYSRSDEDEFRFNLSDLSGSTDSGGK